jgi:hypothetical protein
MKYIITAIIEIDDHIKYLKNVINVAKVLLGSSKSLK